LIAGAFSPFALVAVVATQAIEAAALGQKILGAGATAMVKTAAPAADLDLVGCLIGSPALFPTVVTL